MAASWSSTPVAPPAGCLPVHTACVLLRISEVPAEKECGLDVCRQRHAWRAALVRPQPFAHLHCRLQALARKQTTTAIWQRNTAMVGPHTVQPFGCDRGPGLRRRVACGRRLLKHSLVARDASASAPSPSEKYRIAFLGTPEVRTEPVARSACMRVQTSTRGSPAAPSQVAAGVLKDLLAASQQPNAQFEVRSV
jgi:hypothetical protein